ncbi:uncharacterized protein LOC115065992 [Bactrocera dorsalis]|uniref:Uncharacterized protein LOC115065992 n=1 Tax=Bactrocera dorsalis TaxID=27457 RepID=A0A8N4KXS1_BACDO|nr:uncharacterized protein LOC115065992 [Bactrocera dorsalis]
MQSAAPGFVDCFTEVPTRGFRILSPCAKIISNSPMRVQLLAILVLLVLGLIQGYELRTTTVSSDVQPKSTPSFIILLLRRIFFIHYRSITYSNGSTERSTQVNIVNVLSPSSPVTVATTNTRRKDASADDSVATLDNPRDDSFAGLHPTYKWKFPKKYAGDFKKDMTVKAKRQRQEKL